RSPRLSHQMYYLQTASFQNLPVETSKPAPHCVPALFFDLFASFLPTNPTRLSASVSAEVLQSQSRLCLLPGPKLPAVVFRQCSLRLSYATCGLCQATLRGSENRSGTQCC